MKMLGVAMLLLGAAWLLAAPQDPKLEQCTTNLKMLRHALEMYSADYDDLTPQKGATLFAPSPKATGPKSWKYALWPYMKSYEAAFCPAQKDQKRPSYALNDNARGKRFGKLPANLVLFYDASPGAGKPDCPHKANGKAQGNAVLKSGKNVGFTPSSWSKLRLKP